jgi:hypothetical protein
VIPLPMKRGEPRERIDVVELGRLDQRGDDRPVMGAAVCPSEQGVLSSRGNRAHRALNGVGVQFQASVIEEQDQSVPGGPSGWIPPDDGDGRR